MTSIYKKLLDIQQKESWSELDQYTQSENWACLVLEEKLLLAQLFLKKGALELSPLKRYPESFRIAERLFPVSPELFFQEAQLFLADRRSFYHLVWAEKALARTTQLAPHFLQGWVLRIQVLLDLILEGKSDPWKKLQLAEKCFHHIQTLLPHTHQEAKLLSSQLAANISFYKAKLSGEPKDWQNTLEYHKQLEALGYRSTVFFFQYAEIYAHLGRLVKDTRFNKLALTYYDHSLAIPPPHSLALLHKALLLADWGESVLSTEILRASWMLFHQLFQEAPRKGYNRTDEALLWLRWGEIEIALAKQTGEFNHLASGLEKLEKAYQLNPHYPKIVGTYAEAQLNWGANQGCLFSLNQARQKAEQLLRLQPTSPDPHYLLGCCLLEQGRYFDDTSYYQQAISQFQSGLSIQPHHAILWYVLGTAHFSLGEQNEDIRLLEKAVRHFAKAQECKIEDFPEFWADWGTALLKLAEYRQEFSLAEMAIHRFLRSIGLHPSGEILNQLEEKKISQTDSFTLHNLSQIGGCFDLISRLRDDPIALEQAIDLWERVVELAPDSMETRYQLACSLTDVGCEQEDKNAFTRAHTHFQELLARYPENDLFHFDYALSLIGFVQCMFPSDSIALYSEMEYHLQAAARLGNQEAYYHMGCLFAFLGKEDRALFSLERAFAAKALPPIEQILEEEWLSPLYSIPSFLQWIKKISPKQSGLQ